MDDTLVKALCAVAGAAVTILVAAFGRIANRQDRTAESATERARFEGRIDATLQAMADGVDDIRATLATLPCRKGGVCVIDKRAG